MWQTLNSGEFDGFSSALFTTLLPTPTFVAMMSSSSFSTHQKRSVFLPFTTKSVLFQPRRREHQQRNALNFIVQSKHHHHHHRSLRVQTQHHLKKTSTSVRASKDETTENTDETMKDVQVTLVDCVASDGAKMTKETRRNAEGSIEEMDNCRFVRHRFNWWTPIQKLFFLRALSVVVVVA